MWNRRRSIQTSGALRYSTDRHSHILHGVDDGISSPQESLEALAFEEAMGVRKVWCTPHIMEEVPNGTQQLKDRFEQLKAIYHGPVEMDLAAEYMIDRLFLERLNKGDILTMEENMVLVETSSAGAPYGFEEILAHLLTVGYRPLLAHPERYAYLRMPDCKRIRKMGVLFQLNIASLTGIYGKEARIRAESFLKEGMYFAYGSDCHSAEAMKHQYSEKEISRDVIRRISTLEDNI